MKRVLVSTLVVSAFAIGLARGVEVSLNSGGPDALVVLPGSQTDGPRPNFGVGSQSSMTYASHAFIPVDSTVTYAFSSAGGNLSVYRNNAAGSVWMEAPINLPNGSLIEAVEFRFCDTSATSAFGSFLTINDKAGTVTQPTLVTSTNAENIGCVNRTFTFGTPVQVDNGNQAYSLEVNFGSPGDDTIQLSHARVIFRLQVTPAPAVATFPNDVPTTHPFFRFIEALAASGITAGTGPGEFQPETPITRGQMAVFLALALGLHFPN